ncbi:cysteine desulfurase family protein [Parapedomonas caeni]
MMSSAPEPAAARRGPPLYLDYQATTPMDEVVLAAMLPYFGARFGNPHSSTHRYGWEAMAGVDVARGHVAGLIGASPEEIIFLSGATEANNLALKGALMAAPPARRRLVTLVTEHACVRETAAWLGHQGYDVVVLPVDSDGLIRLDELDTVLDDQVALVSVMAVNNEIGVAQPLAEIGRRCRAAGALFHTDAAQAFGKVPLDVEAMGIDLMSLSAHKIYGPKGVGALYVRARTPLAPQMHGGGQERGLRSGTLAPALCVGFGEAARLAAARLGPDLDRLWGLFNQARTMLEASGIAWRLNGSAAARFPGNLNVSFPGVDGARLLADLRGLALSSGAACASAVGKPSYVLDALGLDKSTAQATLRIGLGRPTTADDVATAMTVIVQAVREQTEVAWRR